MTSGPGRFEPLPPVDAPPLFPELGRELLALLRSLAPEEWENPTVCKDWTVRDIAAHLLDGACRRLSLQRDALPAPRPEPPPRTYDDLVAFLNDLNAVWVRAFRRVSPRLVAELLAAVEPPLAELLASLEPEAPAQFPVAWAGEDASPNWFDTARELTERWHHQQQIRLAVGAPSLDPPHLFVPVLETLLRAVPRSYRAVEAPPEATLELDIEHLGHTLGGYLLRHGAAGAWSLGRGSSTKPLAGIRLDGDTCWRLFCKALSGREARRRASSWGRPELIDPFFSVVAVMA